MFRLLIFFPLILFSQDFFLLPDEADPLMKAYNSDLKHAKKEVFIFTPHLDEYALTGTLKKLSKHSIPIVLITQDPLNPENRASRLSLYKNISVFTLHSLTASTIQGSFICIDDEKYYMITQTLQEQRLSEIYAFALYKEAKCSYLFTTLLKRSTPY